MSGRALTEKSPYIVFADPAVKAIYVANWGGATGGATGVAGTDGEMTYEQSAAVTSSMFGQKFQYQNITSFDELRFFTALTSIPIYGFYQNSFNSSVLQSIILPDSITSISTWSFGSTGLQTIEIPDITSIGSYAFYNCQGLVSVKLGRNSSITTIPAWIFEGNISLENIIGLPTNITSIGEYSFEKCKKLKKLYSSDRDGLLNIPEGVVSIGSAAFMYCESIDSIVIPSTVTSISNACFANCKYLQNIIVKAVVPPTLGVDVFVGTNNCPIYVPDASVADYKAANRWSSYASRIKGISEMPSD